MALAAIVIKSPQGAVFPLVDVKLIRTWKSIKYAKENLVNLYPLVIVPKL